METFLFDFGRTRRQTMQSIEKLKLTKLTKLSKQFRFVQRGGGYLELCEIVFRELETQSIS